MIETRRTLLQRKLALRKQQLKNGAKDRLALFLNYTMPSYQREWFHDKQLKIACTVPIAQYSRLKCFLQKVV